MFAHSVESTKLALISHLDKNIRKHFTNVRTRQNIDVPSAHDILEAKLNIKPGYGKKAKPNTKAPTMILT